MIRRRIARLRCLSHQSNRYKGIELGFENVRAEQIAITSLWSSNTREMAAIDQSS